MRTFSLLICVLGCGDSGIIDCDPSHYPDDCAAKERCDASSKKCETAKSCTQSSECGGYACSISSVCERNCRGQTGPDDSLCDGGYRCNTSFACAKVASCQPTQDTTQCNGLFCDAVTKTCKASPACNDDTPCGSYSCEVIGGFCRLACGENSHCASGKTCDTTASTCK